MKIVIVGSKSFDSLEYNLNETFNQQVKASKEAAIRQHPIIFPILRIAVSSLNESKEQGKCNDSHHQQCPKNADRCGCDIDNAAAFLAPHT